MSQTTSTSFTTVLDALTIRVPRPKKTVSVAISGTYNMVIKFQRAATPDQTAWETLATYSTANATVAANFTSERHNEVFRLIVTTDTSGTAVVSLTEAARETEVFKDSSGATLGYFNDDGLVLTGDVTIGDDLVVTSDAAVTGALSVTGGIQPGAVSCTASTLTVTAALHAGKTIVLDLAAGIAVTLPAATGTGNVYKFFVKTTFTGAASIKSVAGADVWIGHAILGNNSDNTVVRWPAIASDTFDGIDLLGTANSTGGMAGQVITLTDIDATTWGVEVVGDAAGTEATPFTNTVA